MLKQNMTQHGTQATSFGVMVCRCSPDSQHGRPSSHPVSVGSSFRNRNGNLRNYSNHRRKRKTWTREDNQLPLHYCFWSSPKQRGFKKKMIEIWQEYSIFQTTNQRLADQVRKIMKKDCFFDYEIIEIPNKIHNQQVPDKSNIKNKNSPIEMNL